MKIASTVFLSIFWCSCFAQYFQFSQYNFTPQRISPAYVASSDYASISAIHRNQYGTGLRLYSTMLNVSYPLISAKHGRWSGVGLSFLDDRSGSGIFRTQEAAVSYAVVLNLAPQQSISFGAKVLYQTSKVDFSGFTTGSQYVQDRGFDSSLPLGEDLGQLNNHFVTFSLGTHWQKTDQKESMLAYWDVSFFDFNRPDNSFTDQPSSLSGTFVAAGGLRVLKKGNMSLYPEVLYTRSAANNVLNAGFLFRCNTVPEGKGDVPHVDFIAKYVFGRSGIFGFQFHNDKFGLGFSTDIPLFVRNVANISSVEIGLILKSLVNKEVRKSESNRSRIPQQTKGTPGKKLGAAVGVKMPVPAARTKSDSAKTIASQQLSDRLRQKQDSVVAQANPGAVIHEPLILEKATLYFSFEFNSAAIDSGSTQYLDDLAKALLDNPELKIKLEGHTDNVGSGKFNLRLSLERAKAVKEYLITKGVEASRIDAEGKGMAEPLNANQTEEERATNRRVELEILYDH